jgi:hypothetical protein
VKCEACFGTGKFLRRSWPGNELLPYPCEVCGGTGFDHCCSGDSAANDPPAPVHSALRDNPK